MCQHYLNQGFESAGTSVLRYQLWAGLDEQSELQKFLVLIQITMGLAPILWQAN